MHINPIPAAKDIRIHPKTETNEKLTQWRGDVTLFNKVSRPVPCKETLNASWSDIVSAIKPKEPALINDKADAKVFVPCALKELPNLDGAMEKRRSKDHVTMANLLVVDLDGLPEANFQKGLTKLKAEGVTYIAYTTFSHGLKPDMRVRLVLPLDSAVNTREYGAVWRNFDAKYFNGADPSGAKMYQAQATYCCHPDRQDQTQTWENTAELLSVEELLILLPSETASSKYPLADANKIADKCQQIGAFRDSRGADQSEPVWFDCLGVVAHCTDGERLCHEWSSGYTKYNELETEKKIAHRLKAAPTTCAQFKKSNLEGCQGCTQSCHSAIVLGQKRDDKKIQPIPAEKFPNKTRSGVNIPATIENVAYMLAFYGISVQYNVITKKLIANIPELISTVDNADNVAMTHIISLANLNQISASQVPDLVLAIADRHQVNPVADWINSKMWDGVDRLPDFYKTLETEAHFPERLKETLMFKWALSTVAAALKPRGFRCRGILTLQGLQSMGKTAWVSALVPDTVLREQVIKVDHPLDPSDKDSKLTALEHWIVELGELESSFKKDIDRLKGFVTSDMDKIRRPYARANSEYPRKTVFVATVNDANFLVDPTGNTRFWTLPLASINYTHGIDMQQVFAQLAIHYHSGETWWLDREDEQELERFNNSNHRTLNVIREMLMCELDLSLLDGKTKLEAYTAIEVLVRLKVEKPTNAQLKECRAALREILGESKRIRGSNNWYVPFISGSEF
jgi:putative DNA primase/helicase